MRDYARRIVIDRARRDRGRDYGNGNYRGTMDYEGDYARGIRGTGRYGRGGSMYRGDYARRDYNDYDDYEDYEDYGEMRLTKSDMMEWKDKLRNADGTLGEHFKKEQIQSCAERLGIRYEGYDEKELCMTANMLYSDYCEALRSVVPAEKEAMVYTKMAKAFLEDEDAPEGSEKLALYFRHIAQGEMD